jgi:hypothetical protein
MRKMIDAAAWAHAALAANTPAVASTMMQLAATGFNAMWAAREQCVHSELELDYAARRRSETSERLVIVRANEAPHYPSAGAFRL